MNSPSPWLFLCLFRNGPLFYLASRELLKKATLRILACMLFCSTLLAQSNNPIPFINQPLVPTSVVPGSQGFTLSINGAGFVPGSIVHWNGSPRTTVLLSGTSLQATINASDVAHSTTAWITVVNPAPGGGTSSVAYFFIREAAPAVAMDVDPNFSAPGFNVVGDFNNDQKLDIAVASSPKPRLLVIDMYPGTGKGQFGTPVETRVSGVVYSAGRVLAADFNGDGNLDLAVMSGTSSASCKIAILLGDGHGGFSAKSSVSSFCESMATADFNGDGKLDLIMSGGYGGTQYIDIWFGNGDGTFRESQRIQFGGGSLGYGLAIGDFNGDGALDFAVPRGKRNFSVEVFINNGGGTFKHSVTTPVSYAGQIAAADVNGDGILDLVSGSGEVLLGNGDASFTDKGGVQISGGLPVLEDFNADGKVDVVVGGTYNGFQGTLVLLGNGDGTFQVPIETRGYGGTGADFFHNGSLDLVGLGNVGVVLWQTDVGLLPSAMGFGNQDVGTSSQPQTATLTNASPASVTISGIVINGMDPQDYSQVNNCPASLPVSGSCQIQVTFTPTMAGSRTAALSVSYLGHGSPQTVPLSGTGVAVVNTVSLTPSSLTFPVQLINTTSKPQAAKLTNTGTVDVLISSISAGAPFSQTNNCPSDLSVGKSCQIKVTFTPQTKGPANGTLSVTDNAQGSPQTVSLSGTGMVVKLSPIGINFGNQNVGTTSSPVPVTLTNEGTDTLNISQITIMGPDANDFAQTNNCGSSVPPQGQCTIQVTFTPTQKGQRSASLDIYDDGGGSPQGVALSGTGT